MTNCDNEFPSHSNGGSVLICRHVCESLSVANAVELFKLVFLSTSTAPEVRSLLAETLKWYSEGDLTMAFNYLKEMKLMVLRLLFRFSAWTTMFSKSAKIMNDYSLIFIKLYLLPNLIWIFFILVSETPIHCANESIMCSNEDWVWFFLIWLKEWFFLFPECSWLSCSSTNDNLILDQYGFPTHILLQILSFLWYIVVLFFKTHNSVWRYCLLG